MPPVSSPPHGFRKTEASTGAEIPGFNFKWGHRVTPDPENPKAVYITTFGGDVWHGTARHAAKIAPSTLQLQSCNLQNNGGPRGSET
jgi:hypothetical protein